MSLFDWFVMLGFVGVLLAWMPLSLYVLAIDRRRRHARTLLASALDALRHEDARRLPAPQRIALIEPHLQSTSRELVMQAAADPDTPVDLFETLLAYLVGRFGKD